MSLGISSVYFARKITDGGQLLDALLALGCDGLELEYRIGAETFRAMERRLDGVPILSVHAFFPNPGVQGTHGGQGANAFLFSSPDREERETAVRHGVGTIETAARLGARAVVLHLGRVDLDETLLERYRRLECAPEVPATELRDAVDAVRVAREHLARPHLDAVLRCLDRLNAEALRRGILLGIENRFHPHEIPDYGEVDGLLREFRGGALRYWHDVGHALNQERLGIATQQAWLERYGPVLVGTHLHDIRRGRDHLAPGTGEADFAGILRCLPTEALKIMEIRPSVPQEEVLAGRNLLRGLGY